MSFKRLDSFSIPCAFLGEWLKDADEPTIVDPRNFFYRFSACADGSHTLL